MRLLLLVECNKTLPEKAAAEFSFFLAVPTMLAVTFIQFCKDWNHNGVEQKGYEMILRSRKHDEFFVGNLVAFVVAVIAIKFFIGVLNQIRLQTLGVGTELSQGFYC